MAKDGVKKKRGAKPDQPGAQPVPQPVDGHAEAQPSAEDVALTRRLADAGELLGIPVLDHVVVGANGYVSLAERGVV